MDFRNSFVLENGLEPKNPLWAERGLGCTDFIIKCLGLVIKDSFFCALLPHKIKTMGSFLSLRDCIILSVNISQPIPLWELGQLALTVKTVFNSSTPWVAQFSKKPLLGIKQPKSLLSS